MLTLPNQINDFTIILLSILVEGIPFILAGSILSAIVQKYLSEQTIVKFLPKNKLLQKVGMSLMGNLIPVCECGNIPLAKRMLKKNLSPALTISFLLAAPVFNPLVIASTIAAFPGNYSILIYRLLFTLIIAVAVAYIFEKLPAKKVINANLADVKGPAENPFEHDEAKRGLIATIKGEFLQMTSLFLLGAIIAALVQTLIPKEIILSFNNQEWIAIIAMMVLAFVISICANVDAFFALAYAQIFPTSSILAFLVFGPMIDIKAIPMLKSIFTWRGLTILVSLIALLTFLLSYSYFLFS